MLQDSAAAAEFTCAEVIPAQAERLHLHLEGVDEEILGHAEGLPLAAHVRVSHGAVQVIEAVVLDEEGVCRGRTKKKFRGTLQADLVKSKSGQVDQYWSDP